MVKVTAPTLKKVTPSSSPTTKPLNFSQMNNSYGPCAKVPVFMYHHIQPASEAAVNKQTGLNTDNELFKKQLEHLKSEGYRSIFPADLVDFFDNGKALPTKPLMLTFDDGYEDNYVYAYPILREEGFKAVIYLPTGLMENPGYLSWNQIQEMAGSGVVVFGNHTWSHMSVEGNTELVRKEISTADSQLSQRGLNKIKTFAYPYGATNGTTKDLLSEMGYKLGFTEVYGTTLCKGKRMALPRVRAYHALSF